MNIGSFLQVGSTHNVCEDYVMVGNITDDIKFGVVCDGCSASPEVNVGSRILTYLTKIAILQEFRYENVTLDKIINRIQENPMLIGRIIMGRAWEEAAKFGFSQYVYDCTLLIVIGNAQKSVILTYGDGGAIIKFKDGSFYYNHIVFDSGAPYYLSYIFHMIGEEDRHDGYMQQFGNNTVTISKKGKTSDGERKDEIHLLKSLSPDIYVNYGVKVVEDFESISLVSDGIHSFQYYEDESQLISSEIDYREIAEELTLFKNTKGTSFVTRRVNRMTKNLIKKYPHGVFHYDDLSVATLIHEI